MPEGYNGAYTGQQIDEGIAKANGALPQSGGVMTGPLGLAGDPAGENEATRKAYVDNVAQTVQSNLTAHTGNTNNPHGVTAEQVGADVAGSAAAVTATLNEAVSSLEGELASKAPLEHSHLYAGAASAGGPAASAEKWASPRQLSFSGDVSGSASFDGSQDITLQVTVNGGNANSVGGVTADKFARLDGANQFQGEQKYVYAPYCPEVADTAGGIACAFKASRGLYNEALLDKIIMTQTTAKLPFYSYTGSSEGQMTGLKQVAEMGPDGSMWFGGEVTVGENHEALAKASHSHSAADVGADAAGSAAAVAATLTSHTSNSSNPHSVTAEQVGARPDTWTPTAAEVGAAAASHSHGAGEITSGVLAIANGGTGYSSITDSSYSTARYRASALFASETAPTVNGVIHWTYE